MGWRNMNTFRGSSYDQDQLDTEESASPISQLVHSALCTGHKENDPCPFEITPHDDREYKRRSR